MDISNLVLIEILFIIKAYKHLFLKKIAEKQNVNRIGMTKRILLSLVAFLLIGPICSLADPPESIKYRMGTMEGQVFYDNKPVGEALLAFFDETRGLPPIAGISGRIPDSLGRTDFEGKFKVKLMQGSYYLGILLRPLDSPLGPPREGEKFYFATDDQRKLKKLSIDDLTQIDVGRIDSSLPEVFQESEENFTVEGTVYREEGGEPFAGAIVMAKTSPTMRRPEYFSQRTGKDGKFSLKLPPGKNFYIVAREIITGTRPTPGEAIGKYGSDSYDGSEEQQVGGPPPGVEKKNTPKIVAESIPVFGAKDEVISGMKIVMYKMPDQNKLRSENMRLADAPNYQTGFAISNLNFDFNSYELDERAFEELDLWVNYFTGRQDIPIVLIGHTDNIGSDTYNLNLSKKRAETVASYFVNKGINAARITIEGAGAANPIADNTTEEGRSKNRRVDIKFEK